MNHRESEQLQFVQRFWVGEQFARQTPGHLGCVLQRAEWGKNHDPLRKEEGGRPTSNHSGALVTDTARTCEISHGKGRDWAKSSADTDGTADTR